MEYKCVKDVNIDEKRYYFLKIAVQCSEKNTLKKLLFFEMENFKLAIPKKITYNADYVRRIFFLFYKEFLQKQGSKSATCTCVSKAMARLAPTLALP